MLTVLDATRTGTEAEVGRPIGNLLFLVPTRSGKTRIVEATAEAQPKAPGAIIRIDCAEFQHSHEIAKIMVIGPSCCESCGAVRGVDLAYGRLLCNHCKNRHFEAWQVDSVAA